MSAISTHVLDISRGSPASAVHVGRCTELLRDIQLEAVTYRLNFNVGDY